MDEQQTRINEDLTGLLSGELRFDPLTLGMYASDASLYQITPVGVAFPRDRDDLTVLAKYADEHELPLIPRGAGSNVTGSALGRGLVIDFSRHMNRVEEIGATSVRVQPGVVRNRLNDLLKPYGRYYPPDPAMAAVTTIGGMLGVDAAGSHAYRVGSARDHVSEIGLVLASGHAFDVGIEKVSLGERATRPKTLGPVPTAPDLPGIGDLIGSLTAEPPSDAEVKRHLCGELTTILHRNRELIETHQPNLIRNTCGYFLRNVLRGDGPTKTGSEVELDLPRMLVGSEGTLGLFSHAVLDTIPLAEHRGVALLLFGSLEEAVRAVRAIVPHQPSACDLVDRRLLSLGREADARFARLIPSSAEAGLIVEQVGISTEQIKRRMHEKIRSARGVVSQLIIAAEAYDPDGVELLWSLPQTVVPLLTRLEGQRRPQPFVEDIAVPPELVHDFLIRSQKVFQKHDVTASLYAHAASGQIHLRPFLRMPTANEGPRLEAIARDLYTEVRQVGGSISGEHGDGLSRTSFIRSQYGPLYRVFQEIKSLFDPRGVMNPGKIVSDDPHLTIKNFRPPLIPPDDLVPLQLTWGQEELVDAVARCNGCGLCRTHDPDLRMCPFHRVDPDEETAPRSKVNILRNYLSGTLPVEAMTGDEMRRLSATCFNCKQCELECTSHVNVPQMATEMKAAYVSANGLSRADWILSRAHSFGPVGTALSVFTNWTLANPYARWWLEKLFGIARERKLPSFAKRSFLRTAPRDLFRPPKLTDRKRGVIYFLDHYANYHDPELARSLIEILEHHGYRVYIPPEQTGSGMAMVSAGDLEAARDVAERNIRAMAEYAREGWRIVCTEPAAALCLSQEYPRLIDHPDVAVIAGQVVDAGAFLAELRDRGELRTDLAPLPLRAGYHTPCHLKALAAGRPLRELVTLVPELEVIEIEKGCSGMAGTFGLTSEHFETSIDIGRELILRMQGDDLAIGLSECSSCKIQMEQGTTTPTLHPLKLLAYSYGLLPEIATRFQPSTRRLIVT